MGMKAENMASKMYGNRFSQSEWEARIELAAAYRLVHHFGWIELIYNHISYQLPDRPDAYLINPYGLAYSEVTASNLVLIDIEGNVLSDTVHRVNRAGFVIHSAIHAARSDAKCVLHTHSRAGVAISCLEEGLVPLTQSSMQFYNRVSYHEFEGFNVHLDEQERLAKSLGKNNVLILRNHGTLTVAETIHKALQRMIYLEEACITQLDVYKTGQPIHRASHEVSEATARVWEERTAGRDAGASDDIEWGALLRLVDRIYPDYRT
jgi:ribulose-5-phosphate 4-epimerase/fuculose-1-phosphate aldolase